MRKIFPAVVLMMVTASLAAQNHSSGAALLKAMHSRYYHAPCKCYTFSQKNTHYKGDSIAGTSEWHEEVGFPDRFRIAFGAESDQNYVQFANDSAYRYRGGKLVNARADTNSLLLILGGMYYRELSDVSRRLQLAGYDTGKLSAGKWDGKEVYILGALEGDSLSNQIWIDKQDLRVHRIIEKLNEKEIMDMRFESHQKWCKGSVENKVSFRRNGRLEQVEEYYNLKEKKCR